MDQSNKLNTYRQILQTVIERHANMVGEPATTESIPICDTIHDNYLLMDVDGEHEQRNGYIVVHLRIKNGKVQIERDGIEYGIVHDLRDLGIAAEDIVFSFYKNDAISTSELLAA